MYKLSELDICLPDYFSGYHNPVLQVPLWKEMTKTDLTNAIVSDYNLLWDYLTDKAHENPWPDLTEKELFRMCDEFILVNEPFINSDIPTADECEDTIDDVYLYIVCEEIDQ
jgi:hypothetical protein